MDSASLIYWIAGILILIVTGLVLQARRQIIERSRDADKEIATQLKEEKAYKVANDCVCFDKHQHKEVYFSLFVQYVERLVFNRHVPLNPDEVHDIEKAFRLKYNDLMEVDLFIDTEHHNEVFNRLKANALIYEEQ